MYEKAVCGLYLVVYSVSGADKEGPGNPFSPIEGNKRVNQHTPIKLYLLQSMHLSMLIYVCSSSSVVLIINSPLPLLYLLYFRNLI